MGWMDDYYAMRPEDLILMLLEKATPEERDQFFKDFWEMCQRQRQSGRPE